MRSQLAAFILAAVAAAIATPVVRRLAMRAGIVSRPGGRHVHRKVVPRLGGIAIYIAFFAPLASLFVLDVWVANVFAAARLKVLGLLIGGTAMCAVGVIDDEIGRA